MWVRAYLRRCQAEDVPAVVVRRGDEAAGAILISVNSGTAPYAFTSRPPRLERKRDRPALDELFRRAPGQLTEADHYPTRQREFDPDLWIIEIEDRTGRHFLGDEAVKD